ncbi:MAG: molybdenum cofactor guanylyltransferase [Pyrinomonadaceae bacterium]
MIEVRPYILIGGRSSRFGRDKATFEFEGEILAARAARIAETAFEGTAAKFVSRTNGNFLDRAMIADVYPGRGAAGAIHAALADASTGWIFVLACDLPLVTPEFIRALYKLIDDEHGCVVPVQPDGRWQPLCAFYQAEICLETFENAAALTGKHPSLRAIAAAVRPSAVEFAAYSSLANSAELLKNLNTFSDLADI